MVAAYSRHPLDRIRHAEIRSPRITLKTRGRHRIMTTLLLWSARRHCSGSIRQLAQFPIVLVRFSIFRLIQTAALVRGLPYDTDSPLLTRSTYLSDHGPCAAVPVYKRPVFRQSSPKLDLILNINVLESSPSASPFLISYISLSESSLATLETSTSPSTRPKTTLSTSHTIKAR